MKRRNLILGFALALGTLGAIGVGTTVGSIGTPNEVEAYAEGDTYKLVGQLVNYSSVGWSGDTGLPLDISVNLGDDDRAGWACEVNLKAGDEFKIVLDYGDSSLGDKWIDNTTTFGDYIGKADVSKPNANFKVLVTGTYRIAVDQNIDTYEDSSYGYEFEKLADQTSYYNSTLIGPGGTAIKTEEISGDAVYNVSWFKVDGYVNRGWYTDPNFKTEYVPAVPEGDVTLYGKWETAPADLIVYYEGDFTHAYIFGTYSNNVWPGVAMEKLDRAWGTNVYKFVVEGEYEATSIIFNDGGQGKQSADITLAKETAVYNGWQDDEGKKGQVAADSDDKLAALDFITEFDTLRKDGSICYLVNETGHEDALNSIIAKYEAIQNKALVDSLEDVGGDADIGTTMAMLIGKKNSTSGIYGVYDVNSFDTAWIVVLALASSSR